ncbi:MAG TPA: polysaccharide deacetylase family protein [Bryobacteraceae bacterium]|nr:polysaccharide deacetylase family protein [Bryobacteraceae bacterium]HOL71869.1 polysaccharide deacetylase family protein [Bryobacteraceae bacterium]HOQ44542.1 polysaccharide deacetylase family protein [Bryobacteraceae bacterium]HPQ16039.1 polysaccharide deacetylase family protein [Bryobacteraceae bacterium]HPU70861.1 polysaccharide deacetylase family protein [Bryobacteraceae bacterium]
MHSNEDVGARQSEEIRPEVRGGDEGLRRRGPVCLLTIDLGRSVSDAWVESALEVLDGIRALATFFVRPDAISSRLTREIASRGHELACLGRLKPGARDCDPDRFREDARETKLRLEDFTGMEVAGYRAPGFSISRRTLQALSILAEEGYRFDSSINGQFHRSPWHAPVIVETDSGRILEVPVTAYPALGLNLPCGGGRSWRTLPVRITAAAMQRLWNNRRLPGLIALNPEEAAGVEKLARHLTFRSVRAALGELMTTLRMRAPEIEVRMVPRHPGFLQKFLYDLNSY